MQYRERGWCFELTASELRVGHQLSWRSLCLCFVFMRRQMLHALLETSIRLGLQRSRGDQCVVQPVLAPQGSGFVGQSCFGLMSLGQLYISREISKVLVGLLVI